MSINVEALIKQLDKPYHEIFELGLIPYKTKPYAPQDESSSSLDMKREGLFLSFINDSQKRFEEISIILEDENKTDWMFPNDMPFGLGHIMTKNWVREHFGLPMMHCDAEVIFTVYIGMSEFYTLFPPNQNIVAKFTYNKDLFVSKVTFTTLERALKIKQAIEKIRINKNM